MVKKKKWLDTFLRRKNNFTTHKMAQSNIDAFHCILFFSPYPHPLPIQMQKTGNMWAWALLKIWLIFQCKFSCNIMVKEESDLNWNWRFTYIRLLGLCIHKNHILLLFSSSFLFWLLLLLSNISYFFFLFTFWPLLPPQPPPLAAINLISVVTSLLFFFFPDSTYKR